MDCKECKNLLSKFLDHELDAKQQKQMSEHIYQCPACAQSLESIQEMVRIMHSIKQVAPPSDFMEKVNEKLDRTVFWEKAGNWLGGLMQPLSYPARAFAVVATVIIVVAVARQSNIVTSHYDGFIKTESLDKEIISDSEQTIVPVLMTSRQQADDALLLEKAKIAEKGDYFADRHEEPASALILSGSEGGGAEQQLGVFIGASDEVSIPEGSETVQLLVLDLDAGYSLDDVAEILVSAQAKNIGKSELSGKEVFLFEIDYDDFLNLHSLLAGMGELEKKTQDSNFSRNAGEKYNFNQQYFKQKIPVRLVIE